VKVNHGKHTGWRAALERHAKYFLLGLLAVSGASAWAQQVQVADTVTNPLGASPAAAAAGRELFGTVCQICHGAVGQGDRERGGAVLNMTGLKHGDSDADIFRVIRNGVVGTQMVAFPGLTDQQVWQLVTFIHSLQNPGSAAASATPVPGDAAAGETLFFGRAECYKCHGVNARGGITGPDLSNAARLSLAALRQKIVAPNNPVPGNFVARGPGGGGNGPAPLTVVVRTPDGREIRGVRRNEDAYSVQMVDASGALHLIDKRKMASVTVESRSLMPDDYAKRLSADDITNLVAYLCAQRGRDFSKTILQPLPGGVSYERLKNSAAEPQNWLTYWGDYRGTHYSSLSQINAGNAAQLKPAWAFPMLDGNAVLESTPLVVDGIMYVTGGGNPATVVALDARTGRQIWRWVRQQKVVNPYQINPFNRGVAILGNRLFVGTLDAALIALDARTGLKLWEVQVADTMEGYNITSAPLVVKDKVITGVAGGEYGTRGFVDAYDPVTGKREWRFYAIPGPGEPGNETWRGDSWKSGGSPTWLTGSFDPELNLLYWTVGNPAEQIDRSVRGELANLYSDSVVALDPDTGKLKWFYQFTPNDGHDWDGTEDVVLVDRVWRGQNRKLLLQGDRNGHFYVLDRTSGAFLSGTPFIYQNWNAGFDAQGHAQVVPGSNSSPEGSFLVYPAGGATNYQAPSYSPLTGLFYLEYSESGQQVVSEPQELLRGQQYLGRGTARQPVTRRPDQPAPNSGIKAIDPEDGRIVWDVKTVQGSAGTGVLATGGGLLVAAMKDGNISVLDPKTGGHLWHFQTGGATSASPMSYAIDGKQYIALAAGNVVFSFCLPE
jgi:alcohol dehydrogenase (cytochrome c)